MTNNNHNRLIAATISYLDNEGKVITDEWALPAGSLVPAITHIELQGYTILSITTIFKD